MTTAPTDSRPTPVTASHNFGPGPATVDRRLTHRAAFGNVFAAAAVSKFGTSISYLAIPLTAVTALNASSGQVGLLGALGTVGFLLVGLPAGAWIDRLPKRQVMIIADLIRAGLLATLPISWAVGVLTLTQLCVVALATGLATVFFDIAAHSYLPHIVDPVHLPTANARLVAADAVNDIGGRSLGGFAVQLFGGPLAIIIDATSYLTSAACLSRIHVTEPQARPARATPDGGLRRQIGDGIRFVAANPFLRPILAAGAITNLSIAMINTMLPIIFVRQLHLSYTALGLYLCLGGVGTLTGSLLARRVSNRLGYGRTLCLVGLAIAPLSLAVPFINRGPMLWLAAGSWLLTTVKVGVDNVLKVSLRQLLTPPPLLARMNATFRFALTGALSAGAALAGLLAQTFNPRAALAVGATGLALVWLPILASPVRSLHHPVRPEPERTDGCATDETRDPR